MLVLEGLCATLAEFLCPSTHSPEQHVKTCTGCRGSGTEKHHTLKSRVRIPLGDFMNVPHAEEQEFSWHDRA